MELRKVFFNRTPQPLAVRLAGASRAGKLLARGQWRKLFNYLLAEVQRWLGSEKFSARPYFLSLEPTDSCQLRCPFCTVPYAKEHHVLAYEDYERLMRELGPWLVRAELYKGGESFLHPRILDMVRLAKSYAVEVSISSNLNALPPGGAQAVAGSGLDVLVASIDGATQQTYEKYRVGGSLEKALSNAAAIARARRENGGKGPELIWQFIVFRHNQHELEAAERLARETGFDHIMFRPGYIFDDPATKESWRSTLPEFSEEKRCSDDDTCRWPWGGVNVFADGSVTLCYMDREKRLDIGRAGELADMMRRGGFHRSARRLIKGLERGRRAPAGEKHPCASCPCFGQSNFWV